MRKIGIIDLGSNTTRLIIMAHQPGLCFRLTDEVSEVARLAEGVSSTGRLQAEPIRRAVEALTMFATFCRSTGVDTVRAVGTSAIREASNQDDFWQALRRSSDLDLQIISAEEEATYGFLGAANALNLHEGFTFDTGGGSTQICAVRYGRMARFASVQAGVVRFTEEFVQSDPISKRDLRNLREGARKAFADLEWFRAAEGQTLAGMGGTVRTLARIDQKQRNYSVDHVHGYILTRTALAGILEQLTQKNRREREQIPGLKSERADVTTAGAVIIDALLEQSGFDQIQVSGQGVREGIFYAHFLAEQEHPRFDDVRNFSVLNLARLSFYEPDHVAKVTELSLSLFDQLLPLHLYGAWEREMLTYGATLHDIGVTVGYYDHHKHSAYLIHNATLLGFNHREVVIIAALARNHRKGQADLSSFADVLAPDDAERVARLSALLRIAEYLERSKSQVIDTLRVEIGDEVQVFVAAHGDASVEIWDANRRSGLFRKAFGMSLTINAA
ncbi:MAG: Ppx/GppA family phosphatase [Oscillochloris sp.]|nr:Ppx/GppA family phosphatase [Oscillochloris sp.]